MSDITSEKLSRFCVEMGVLMPQEADNSLSEAGGSNASLEAYISVLTRKELITNWQLDRLTKGTVMVTFTVIIKFFIWLALEPLLACIDVLTPSQVEFGL